MKYTSPVLAVFVKNITSKLPVKTAALLGMLLVGSTAAFAANVTQLTGDAADTSSFIGSTNWSDSTVPTAGNSYFVNVQWLRTPTNAGDFAFAGDSLTIQSAGGILNKSSGSRTLTAYWILDGGLIRSGTASTAIETYAGTMDVTANGGTIQADQSPYVISAAINLTGTLTNNAPNWTITSSGYISGAGALDKEGANMLIVQNTGNAYNGGTTINGGTLSIGRDNGANTYLGSGDVAVNSGGTLRVGYTVTSNGNRTYTANNITLAGGNIYADDAWQYLTGNINVTGASILGSTYNNAGGEQDKGLFLGGVLSGSAALTVQHSRINTANSAYITSFVAITNNANTYSGTITINENTTGNQGGVYLGVNGSTALANATVNVPGPVAGSGVKFGNSPLVFSSGLGGSATLGALTGSGPVILSAYNEVSHAYVGNIALTVGGNNATTNFAGVLSGGGSLIKAGSGTYTLNGTNTYTGSTTVSAGTLTIGGAGLLGSGNYSGAIVNNSSLTYDSSAAQTLSGPMSGSGSLTIAGSRTLTLGGSQSSSPNSVTVNDGATLNEAFSSAAQLAPTSLTVGNTTGAALGFVLNSTSVARLAPGTLTLNGTATINILGGSLVAGSSYPLIAYTSLAGGGSYTLGSVPGGVAGNLSAVGNTIYFNVTGVTNTIWTGVVNGTWDINTTANWTNSAGGNTYLAGSPVVFDDTGLNTTTISNSVTTVLSPVSILVTNNTLNYCFKTNTIIAGTAGITKTGTAALTNSTPNTYTGSTVINKGAVVAGVATVANVSGALGNNSAVTIANDATAVLNLNGFATQIGSLTGGGTTGGNVVLGSGTLTVGGDNSSPTAYGGVISGTGGLTKIGSGTLALNNTNSYTGATIVSGGKLSLTGSATVPSITAGFLVGNVSGANAAVYQSGNTAVTAQPTGGGWQLGSVAGASGYYNLSSGTMTVTNGGEFDPGGSGGGAGTFGQFDMSGGSLIVGLTNSTGASYFLPNRGGVGEVSVVNISGGTVAINSNMTESATFGGFEINWAAGGQTNTTTISGGAVFTSPSESVKLNQNNNAANVCSLNLNGGLFQILGFTAGHCASAAVNFNGGTLKAGKSANANFMGNVASVYSYGNGGTIDNNGLAISIGQTFSSPTGDGVAAIAVGAAGSGYIVPPQVTIAGDGTGATAYATINAISGAVTGIVVTCPGTGYSTTPTVTLVGGGGSGATPGTVTMAANTSGPMVFTGAGTTTLTGAYSATGGINLLGGTLAMNTANGVPSPAGSLTISSATLTLNASGGSPLPANNVSVTAGSTLNLSLYPYANGISAAGSLTLGTNTTLNLNYGAVSANPVAAAISAVGSLIKGTNIVINISAGGLSVGTVPLITAGSTVTTNNFKLGTLPAGIVAVLTNSTANSLDLLITGAGQLLTWHGANADNSIVMTNWNINADTNWYDLSFNLTKYLQYSGNSYGDNVTFGDYGYNAVDGTNYVNLPATVVPATVTYSSGSPYRLTGAGAIGGATSVLLTNATGTFYLETANTYTGGTIVGGGTLAITNDNALGNASGGITLAGGTLQLNSSITNSRSVTLTANSMLGVPINVAAQLNGTLSGSGGFTKTDNGTLILAGANTNTGATTVSGGTLTVPTGGAINNAAIPNAGLLTVGNIVNTKGILNISGGTVNALYGNGNEWSGFMNVGSVAGAVGDIRMTSGSLAASRHLVLGNGAGAYGAMTMGNGSLSVGSYFIVGFASGYGVFNQSGGAVLSSTGFTGSTALIGSGDNSIGVANLSGGSFISTNAGISISENGACTGVLNISGSANVAAGNAGLRFGNTTATAAGTLNLLGGTATANRVWRANGTANFNFNGGTLKASGANSTFMTGLTAATVYSGGATIDDGGFDITINQPLIAPTGDGVSSIDVSSGGSGYVDVPVVTISGDGTNATATAAVSGGVVTGIVITSPGTGYTYASASVAGGVAADGTAVSLGTVHFAPNTSGGLLKKGSGSLTLSGANTYTGLTVVTNGELFITPAHQTGGAVVVADGAKLGVSASSVTNSATIGALTLGSSGSTTLDFSYGILGNPTNAALKAGAVAINGTSTIRIAGSFALGAFPVMKYTSLSGAFNGTVSAPRGMGASVSNDAVNQTIYVVVTSLASPIVWTGNNSLPGKTNLWDLNTTTNWLVGVDPTTYQETLPPGDAVLFNDIGTGLVLLSNTASPASVTISNSSVNYTFQGSGHISGATGLTKTGAGMVSLNLTNNDYTGPTIISNGTLIVTGGSAIGDSSAVTLANSAGASLVLSNNETIGSLAGGGLVGGNVSLPGSLTAGGDNTSTTYAGAISGSGSLTKVGNGTMSLGGSNSVSGNVWVNSGALGVAGNGSLTTPRMFIAASSGTAGTLNIAGNGTLTNNYSAGGSWWIDYAIGLGVDDSHTGTVNMSGGTVNVTGSVWVSCWGGTGHWNQTGGTVNISGNYWVGAMQDNNTAQPNGSIGTAIISNATLSAGNVMVGTGGAGSGGNPTAVATSRVKGDMTVANGGVVNSENDLQVGRSGEGSTGWGSYGTLNIENGGIVNVASTVTRWMTVGRYNSIDATVNVKSGGTLNLNAGTDLMINEGNNTGIRVVNVSGTIQGTAAGGSYIDLNRNGTAGGTTTFNITNGGVVAVDAIVGKANCTLNFDNGTLKATASDANYIGTGFTVNILSGGAILDTAGFNPTVGGNLLNNGVNEDGGLTKNGNGTLYLNGVNTYTNVTTVNAGLLGGNGTIAGRVVVNANAGLAPGSAGIGTLTINGNITLNANSTNVFEVNGSTPANDRVAAGAGVTYGGVLKIAPTGSFTAGQQFLLFTGAGATNAGNFASVQSTVSGATFGFTNGVLTVLSVGPSGPAQLTNSVSGSTLSLSWPAGQGWRLQMQTNSLSTGLGTNWTYITDGTLTSTNITIDATKPTVFYRLTYP